MEEKQIEVVKNWPEPKSMRDIQVFLGFANFYRHFIQSFSKIAGPLTSMLRTSSATRSSKNSLSSLDVAQVDEVGIGGGGDCEDETVGRSLSKNLNRTTDYLTPNARRAFTKLRQAFTKAPILHHFDPKCHIRIETDTSGYAIGDVLSQLTDLGQWHPVASYFRKMIPAKTRYKTHNGELLTIIEAFKTWRHYLKSCKHKVFVLTDYKILCRFMKTKSLNSHQVWWAQELSRYHLRINYCQNKANGAANALSWFFERSDNEEEKLWAENSQIFHQLQSLLINASRSGFSLSGLNTVTSSNLSPLYQVFIYGTHGLLQLRQFWNTFRLELANKSPYKVSIDNMRLRLQ